jgi:hypothetical protein
MRERESKNSFGAFVHLGVAKACGTVLPSEVPLTKQLWRPARRTLQSQLNTFDMSRSLLFSKQFVLYLCLSFGK